MLDTHVRMALSDWRSTSHAQTDSPCCTSGLNHIPALTIQQSPHKCAHPSSDFSRSCNFSLASPRILDSAPGAVLTSNRCFNPPFRYPDNQRVIDAGLRPRRLLSSARLTHLSRLEPPQHLQSFFLRGTTSLLEALFQILCCLGYL